MCMRVHCMYVYVCVGARMYVCGIHTWMVLSRAPCVTNAVIMAEINTHGGIPVCIHRHEGVR